MAIHLKRLWSITALFLPLRLIAGTPGDLVEFLPFQTVAPEDIAVDEDGTFWISAFLDNKICHYDAALKNPLGQIPYPVAGSYPTGVAFNSSSGTLFVTDALSGRITEIDRAGVATGLVIAPSFEPTSAAPSIRGMSFNPYGDVGGGSIVFVEASGGLIYEVALDGRTLNKFPHPDTPEGFPGRGAAPSVTDVEVILDPQARKIAGYYVPGGRSRITHIRRLEADGSYLGVSIPLTEAGGTVSGILRQPFGRPAGGSVDSYICVVDSNARFAVLEGGEPGFRELTGFQCAVVDRTADLSWDRHQAYERIEISRSCEILATLPGTADHWANTFETDGVHELEVTAYSGAESTPVLGCTVVVGAGAVLKSVDVQGLVPVDLAWDGGDLLLVTDARARKILLKNLELEPVGDVPLNEAFVGEKDTITGVAFGAANRTLYVYNASQSTVGVFDETVSLLKTFPAALPNLEADPEKEPDLGFVIGMAYDAGGDGGVGSLWVVEANHDWIYEIGIVGASEGQVLRSFVHPYLELEPPPATAPFGISAGGISMVAGGSSDEILLGGGALRDLRQTHIVRVSKSTGRIIPGSAIPVDGARVEAGTSFLTIESILKEGKPGLLALSIAGDLSKLLELDHNLPPVQPPTFLRARQPGFADHVELTFRSNGPYDKLEVTRDCVSVGSTAGDASSFIDPDPPPGFHEYAVRGVRNGAVSDWVRVSLQVGPGAVLTRAFLWPARSPQQITQDPTDGSYAIVTNWRDEERKVYFFDRSFQYLSTRDSVLPETLEIAAIAIRAPKESARELNYIAWQQPVPLGQVASQKFLLIKESMDGQLLSQREIDPPRPTNGFITFPTGLTWHEASDTFYYLERNSKTFVQMTSSGDPIRTFPHPSPPFQNFVFNLGMASAAKRGTFFITGSDRHDLRITRAMEMTLDGRLTGVEIPIGNCGITVTGILLRGDNLIAVGTGAFSEILKLKAFSQATDNFIRGDADLNGTVNLTDVIVMLAHLFRGGPALGCEDAADSDDSGTINLTDAIFTLRSLFQGGGPLPAPYPESGFDPTPDGLPCF